MSNEITIKKPICISGVTQHRLLMQVSVRGRLMARILCSNHGPSPNRTAKDPNHSAEKKDSTGRTFWSAESGRWETKWWKENLMELPTGWWNINSDLNSTAYKTAPDWSKLFYLLINPWHPAQSTKGRRDSKRENGSSERYLPWTAADHRGQEYADLQRQTVKITWSNEGTKKSINQSINPSIDNTGWHWLSPVNNAFLFLRQNVLFAKKRYFQLARLARCTWTHSNRHAKSREAPRAAGLATVEQFVAAAAAFLAAAAPESSAECSAVVVGFVVAAAVAVDDSFPGRDVWKKVRRFDCEKAREGEDSNETAGWLNFYLWAFLSSNWRISCVFWAMAAKQQRKTMIHRLNLWISNKLNVDWKIWKNYLIRKENDLSVDWLIDWLINTLTLFDLVNLKVLNALLHFLLQALRLVLEHAFMQLELGMVIFVQLLPAHAKLILQGSLDGKVGRLRRFTEKNGHY